MEQFKHNFILALGAAWKQVFLEKSDFVRQTMRGMENPVDSAFWNRDPRFEYRAGAHRGTMITDAED